MIMIWWHVHVVESSSTIIYSDIYSAYRSFRVFRIIVLSSVPFRSVPFRGIDVTHSGCLTQIIVIICRFA